MFPWGGLFFIVESFELEVTTSHIFLFEKSSKKLERVAFATLI